MGTPSFIRLVKAEGALRLPSADGDDLDLSAADWDPLSLECPDYNDPNYAKSACGVIQGRALSLRLALSEGDVKSRVSMHKTVRIGRKAAN